MQISASLRRKIRRPQYSLTTLFALIAVVSVPLAFRASRERQYRARLRAVEVLGADQIFVQRGDPEPDPRIGAVKLGKGTLQRDDMVTYADFYSSDVSDDDISALMCFPTLRGLNLRAYRGSMNSHADRVLTDAQLTRIATLPLIEWLNLQNTRVSDAGVRPLAALTSLRELDLSCTTITGDAFEGFSSLRELERLDLHDTLVTDAGVQHLKSLPSLRVLNLCRSKISDAALEQLASLRTLRDLDLTATDVGDEGVRCLGALKSLRELHLSGIAPSELGEGGRDVESKSKSFHRNPAG